MKYIIKDELNKIVTMPNERSQVLIKEGISLADLMPVILQLVTLTEKLIKLYPDPLVLNPIINNILHKEIDIANSDEVIVSLYQLRRRHKTFIDAIDSKAFKSKLASNPNNVDELRVNYDLSIYLIVKSHLEKISKKASSELQKQWRKESPHLFKLHDDRMKMYRERYNELMKKKQEETQQNEVEAKEEKEPVKSLTM